MSNRKRFLASQKVSLKKSTLAAAPGGKRGAGRGARRSPPPPRARGPRRPPSEGGPPAARRVTDAHRHGVAAAAPSGARASDGSRDLSERRGQRSRSRGCRSDLF
ncbi:hypothetical protein AB1E18_017253 [Capra hircus]